MSAGSAEVVITGVGMRTPVGNDTVQTAATVRAGISRLAEWPYAAFGPDDEGLTVAAFEPDLGDYPWTDKAEDVADQPLHEALWQAGIYDAAQLQFPPSGHRIAAFLALPQPTESRVEQDAFRLFAIEAKKHCISPAHADYTELHCLDHVSGVFAIGRAIEQLQRRECAVAIVVAFDSHLHSSWLTELYGAGRLKHSASTGGFVPGEAAVVLVLERAEDAEARGAQAVARVAAVGLDQELIPQGGPERPRGDGLTRATRACMDALGPEAGRVERVISDVNGERWRSYEYSVVASRCLTKVARGFQHWHPADCVGDVGAASAPLAVGLAARAFDRRYAGAGGILVLSSAYSGERGALALLPPTGGHRG